MISTALGDVGIANVILGGIVTMLSTFAGFVMRAVTKGDLVPRSTVDRWLAERDTRITAQAEGLTSATPLVADQQAAITSLTASVRDLAEAQQLNVRVANALHQQLTKDGAA